MVIVEKLVEWRFAGETEVLGENLPQRHFVHHKSTRAAAAVGSQRLTAWAMARPYLYNSFPILCKCNWVHMSLIFVFFLIWYTLLHTRRDCTRKIVAGYVKWQARERLQKPKRWKDVWNRKDKSTIERTPKKLGWWTVNGRHRFLSCYFTVYLTSISQPHVTECIMQGDCEWRNEKYAKDAAMTSLTHFCRIHLVKGKAIRVTGR
jgi:hypothetical protein